MPATGKRKTQNMDVDALSRRLLLVLCPRFFSPRRAGCGKGRLYPNLICRERLISGFTALRMYDEPIRINAIITENDNSDIGPVDS